MIPLPAFIDAEAWAGFCEMRKSKGKSRPFTQRAAKMILAELYKIRDLGHCPNASLDQSTLNGWSDVFVPKEKPMTKAPGTAPNKALEAMQAHKNALADPVRRQLADDARRNFNQSRGVH